MSNIKCPQCNDRDVHITPYPPPESDIASCYKCGYTGLVGEFPEQNLFDRITASPEVLAPKFVYHVTSFLDGLDKPKKVWYSTLINNQYFNTELEAKRATVARLKEVHNETTSN